MTIQSAQTARVVERPLLKSDRDSFAVSRALGRKSDTRDPLVQKMAAGQLVSEMFFAPLLAEMRKFPIGKDFLTEGRTEAIFNEELDKRTADLVATSSGGSLGQNILRKMAQHS